MSGPLALIGGGEFTDGCTFDAGLLEAAGADEVLVAPTGAAYEHPQRSVDRAVEWFATLGVRATGLDLLARPDASDPDVLAAIKGARALYLVGGSPMHLRSVLKDSPAWDALVEAWHAGALVAGSDAGAMVLGDPMVDPRGGAFTLGLGLVANVAVMPGHDHWSSDASHRTLKLSPPDLVIAGVDTATALIRDPDGTWRSDGVGRVVVFRGGRPADLGDLPG